MRARVAASIAAIEDEKRGAADLDDDGDAVAGVVETLADGWAAGRAVLSSSQAAARTRKGTTSTILFMSCQTPAGAGWLRG